MVDRNRIAAGSAALLVHVVLGCAILFALATRDAPILPTPAITIFAVPDRPPPAHHPPPPPPRLAEVRGGSAPQARAVVRDAPAPAPVAPIVPLPTPVLPAANGGAGEAHGIEGNGGNGGNGYGDGSGDGYGDGRGQGVAPRRIRGRISDRDFPRELSEAGIGGTVSVRYRVGVDGRVSGCAITRSSGDARLDAVTCQLIEKRFRFRPSEDGRGNKVNSIIVENHSWIVPDPEAPPR